MGSLKNTQSWFMVIVADGFFNRRLNAMAASALPKSNQDTPLTGGTI